MNTSAKLMDRSIEIDLFAGFLLIGGILGMAGALVSPQLAGQSWLLVRTLALGGLMVIVSLGLFLRHDWARRFAAGAMMYAIYAQLSRRWMQSDVVQAWFSCAQGSSLQEPIASGDLPPLAPEAALISLIVCLVLARLTRRLLSARMRCEFGASCEADPLLAPRGKRRESARDSRS